MKLIIGEPAAHRNGLPDALCSGIHHTTKRRLSPNNPSSFATVQTLVRSTHLASNEFDWRDSPYLEIKLKISKLKYS